MAYFKTLKELADAHLACPTWQLAKLQETYRAYHDMHARMLKSKNPAERKEARAVAKSFEAVKADRLFRDQMSR